MFRKYLVAILCVALCGSALARGGHGGGGHSGGGHSGGGSHSSGRSSHAATGTGASHSKTHVSSYTKKNGTHVAVHDRSSANQTKTDNWSTKGNRNPETGKPGTR
jgi:hypothetical protein